MVIHAEHYNHSNTNDQYILWNNNYEYMFNHVRDIDFYIVATQDQKESYNNNLKNIRILNPKYIQFQWEILAV